MFKLPSLSYLYQQSTRVAVRFPGPILAAVVGTMASIILIEITADYEIERVALRNNLTSLILTCALGLPLLLSFTLIGERQKLPYSQNLILQLFGVLLLGAYFFWLPEHWGEAPNKHRVRFFVINTGLHFLVAFAPFIRHGNLQGFWQYNRILFIRILTAVLYSGVLYLGLTVALLGVHYLLELEIEARVYGQLWVVIAGLFNTWFFLAGVPRNLSQLDTLEEYPEGLKMFTQYVLIPLVTIYMIILYLYIAKIAIAWTWPEGWIGWLVLSFSVVGILSLLLVHPIRNQTGNRWIRIYTKWYYIILLPLVVLLLMAIWRRVSEYGFTENRYFVVVLALWLGGISIYYILSRVKNIKYIPLTLFLIALLSSFGPWSAFNVAEQSQLHRLERLLTRNDILAEGKIQKVESPDRIPFEDRKEISAIIDYMTSHHELDGLRPWFHQPIDSLLATPHPDDRRYSSYEKREALLEAMGLEYIRYYEDEPQTYDHLTFQIDESEPLRMHERARILYIERSVYSTEDTILIQAFELDTKSIALQFHHSEEEPRKLFLQIEGRSHPLPFQSFLDTLLVRHRATAKQNQTLEPQQLQMKYNTPELQFTFHFINLRLEEYSGPKELKVDRMEGVLEISAAPSKVDTSLSRQDREKSSSS